MSARLVVEFTEDQTGSFDVERSVEAKDGTDAEVRQAMALFELVGIVIMEAQNRRLAHLLRGPR